MRNPIHPDRNPGIRRPGHILRKIIIRMQKTFRIPTVPGTNIGKLHTGRRHLLPVHILLHIGNIDALQGRIGIILIRPEHIVLVKAALIIAVLIDGVRRRGSGLFCTGIRTPRIHRLPDHD